jgi:hypothetical protein
MLAISSLRDPDAPGLAGRRDFFRSFVVTFIEDAEAPSYILTQR